MYLEVSLLPTSQRTQYVSFTKTNPLTIHGGGVRGKVLFVFLKLHGKCKQNVCAKFGIIYFVTAGTYINCFSLNSKDRC